jgi:1,3-beta-glucanosyltransferase GAS1
VQPDFSNLQAQWAAATPTGVNSAKYAATVKTVAPSCPAFTAGGWEVDAAAALPTLGAEGVSSGMPNGVPTGSITVAVDTSKPSSKTSSTSLTYVSTGNPNATGEAAGSATSEGAAGPSASNPISMGEMGFASMVVALLAVGAGVMLLL